MKVLGNGGRRLPRSIGITRPFRQTNFGPAAGIGRLGGPLDADYEWD
jgi:hypothetical protein